MIFYLKNFHREQLWVQKVLLVNFTQIKEDNNLALTSLA